MNDYLRDRVGGLGSETWKGMRVIRASGVREWKILPSDIRSGVAIFSSTKLFSVLEIETEIIYERWIEFKKLDDSVKLTFENHILIGMIF